MPIRLVKQSIGVCRDNATFYPPIGDPKGFDFTADELETLMKINPAAIGKIVRSVEDEETVVKKPGKKSRASGDEPQAGDGDDAGDGL
jgi:hypothetical protein